MSNYHRILDTKQARKQFSALVKRASQGKTTLLTRQGIPCAALVPPSHTQARGGESFLSLRGSGIGLYGNVARHIKTLRRELDRAHLRARKKSAASEQADMISSASASSARSRDDT